ncbi:hypothetical protein [Sphingopyxis panaciterrulae]|uniref:Uncharacterized protein n=1 Tax=Sphingopyxis panaciterrulae TaxID=462372 RepID=A0A7W9ERU8_9SPHN|nr:hypothetical protein [Sphingopyxis panaciterrulae]MBB5708117.1 hypothetical protein [Sphingopyxis panaciterrulae]
MQEPSVRTSRLAIAGGFAAILVVGGGGFFLGRATAPARPAPPPVVVPAPAPAPVPETPKDLERGDLIALAQRAADAFASGEAVPKAVAEATGRRFELLLPFGCGGPSEAESSLPMQWRYDEAGGTLRVSVKPMMWSKTDWNLGDRADIDAAEGFWITRPWSSSGACPLRAGQAFPRGVEPLTLPGQTLAIAQFFRSEADRDGRRNGRPFETVQRVAADKFDGSRGFRLRISGRIEAVADGGPIRCVQPAGAEQRPICVIGTRIDTVRLENPTSEDVLATWMIGRSAK